MLHDCRAEEKYPLVVKAVRETSVNGSLISKNLDDTLTKLAAIGFKVLAIICDDHSSNVSAFKILAKKFGSQD